MLCALAQLQLPTLTSFKIHLHMVHVLIFFFSGIVFLGTLRADFYVLDAAESGQFLHMFVDCDDMLNDRKLIATGKPETP